MTHPGGDPGVGRAFFSRDFDAAEIGARLAENGAGVAGPLFESALTGSTNDDARRAALDGVEAGAVFVAHEQSAGRGRLGRSWHAPAGESLLLSVVLRPRLRGAELPLVTLAAGLALAHGVASLMRAEVKLKWPNDLLVDRKKVGGVLCEAELGPHPESFAKFVVVGMGLNVHSESFPPALAGFATSLLLLGVPEPSRRRGALLCAICEGLGRRIACLENGGGAQVVEEFSAYDALLGQAFEWQGRQMVGAGLDAHGRLLARSGEGGELQALAAGEVSLGTLHHLKRAT